MVYSLDLRQRALNYIANGGSRLEASKIFGVTVPTLANWLSRQKQQDLAPKMKGSKPSKIDNEKLKKCYEVKEIIEILESHETCEVDLIIREIIILREK